MGIHISIINANYKEHPDWDWMRYAGDRVFDSWCYTLPKEYMPGNDECFRPADFDEWQKQLADKDFGLGSDNHRYEKLLKILRDNPEYYISISR